MGFPDISARRGGWLLIGAVVLITLGIRLSISGATNLFPDEALYSWLAHTAPFEFCPHPPGVPLMVLAAVSALGKTELAVRLPSLVLSLLVLWPFYHLVRRLADGATARTALLLFLCVPIYTAFGAVATPDMPQLFMVTLALAFTWNAFEGGRTLAWAAAGATIGLALYVKYIAILYFPALILCLLMPPHRRHWRTAGPYVAAAVAFLIFVPFAAWRDYLAGWPTLRYHLGDRQSADFSGPAGAVAYQLVHAAYYSPIIYGLALWGMVAAARRARWSAEFGFLAAFSLTPWLFFAAITAVTERDLSREQWDAIAYPPALAAAALLLHQRPRVPRRLVAAACVLGLLTTALFATEALFGSLSRLAGRRPMFSKVTGWKPLAERIDAELAALPATDAGPPFVLTINFAPAFEYAFYRDTTATAYSLTGNANKRYGLEEVLRRTGISNRDLEAAPGRHAIFVAEEHRNTDGSWQVRRYGELTMLFANNRELEPLEITRNGRPFKRYRLFECHTLVSARQIEM